MGLFSKKNKHQEPASESMGVTSVSSRSDAESEYILPTSNVPASNNGHNVYNGPTGASSSKLKLPGFRRKGHHGSHAVVSEKKAGAAARDAKSAAFPSAASEADLDLLKVSLPDKKSLFASPAYGDPQGARSTRSLPTPNERGHSHQGSHDSTRTDMGKNLSKSPDPPGSKADKRPGLFSWAARERTKSKPTRPPSPPVESFNLKSFRHVRPSESPIASPRPVSPSPSIPFTPTPPPPRPRGNSVASESSQRISVAAFREAQARRSAAPSPVPSLRPPSTLDIPRQMSTTPSGSPRVSGAQPTGPRTPARTTPGKVSAPPPPAIPTNSSSDEESEEEEESESGAEDTVRPGRHRTITQKSRSELGHRSPRSSSTNRMQKPSFGSKSEAGHGQPPQLRNAPSGQSIGGSPGPGSRTRASVSTSAMTPNAAAQRASQVAAEGAISSPSGSHLSAHQRQPARTTDTSDSESSHTEDETDEDNAPLARLVPPKRPGTSMSTSSNGSATSRTRKPSQPPLIDVSALGLAPPPPHKADEVRAANSGTPPPSAFSPTNLTERLANLTKGIAGRSTDNVATVERDPLSASAAAMMQPRPRRNTSSVDIGDVPELFAFSPILANPESTIVSPPPKTVTSSPEPMSPATSPAEQAEAKRIVPTPVKQREHTPSFSVTSRPRSTHTVSEPVIMMEPPTPNPALRSNPWYPAVGSGPAPRMSTSSSGSSSQPSTVRPATLVSLIPPGSGFGNTPMPRKPFAEHSNGSRGLRGNSPASSTGDSSSGRAPYTPRDGSDYGNERSWDNMSVSNASSTANTAPRRGHRKSSSVTFEDDVIKLKDQERERGRSGAVPKERVELSPKQAEQKRKERRRSEAKAAIELGNLVNGRGPVDNEDEEDEDAPIGAANMGPRMNMLNPPNPMMGGAMPGMNYSPQPQPQMPWGAWNGAPPTPMLTPQSTGMLSAQSFMIPPPPPNADPNYMVAHERAMMIAKQTYQMAVAQQAMAQAADEWERSSNYAGSTYGGPASSYHGGMGMGMGGWSNGGGMFPAGPRSAYAASDAGSEMGGGWGSRSVFGESFGPPRSSAMPGQGFYPPRTESMGQMAAPQRGPRPRTKSSPHDQPKPSPGNMKKAPPPSSWTARHHTALREGP
ncbi:hypothetical protein OE88DRAFT_1640383 [Heliocybe sulcata]|uniref:Uncharacterized protein n=1 Tax=Heliocybe sulcata TaxID=5364 RepID=A0A5C3NGG4_9AGAM|nr:hypothetical protein OE88DRAFT_1640383 [Heliocybe sulcata]